MNTIPTLRSVTSRTTALQCYLCDNLFKLNESFYEIDTQVPRGPYRFHIGCYGRAIKIVGLMEAMAVKPEPQAEPEPTVPDIYNDYAPVWKTGYLAFLNQQPTNPYPISSSLFFSWQDGYRTAYEDRKR